MAKSLTKLTKILTTTLVICADCEFCNELDKWVYKCGLEDKKTVVEVVKVGFPEWCPLPDSP